jgi:hypothetical protein
MASLTPQHRNKEVTDAAMAEGIQSGVLTLIPTLGALYIAMQKPGFRKVTNWQSRTAMAIMPAFFMFAFTAENKLMHRMHEVAEETEHAIKSVEWAEKQHRLQQSDQDREKLRDLYRHSILESGVRIIPGQQLGAFHKSANYIQSNPFKVIAGIGIPAVAAVYYGRSTKQHLNMQMKLLHTRVFGQFSVICTLLGVMGLKEIMDRKGKYVTEADIEARVDEMEATRDKMLERLEYQLEQQEAVQKTHQKAMKALKH